MGKSNSDTSTRYSSTYTNTTNLNLGLTGGEVAGIIGSVADLALAMQADNAHGYSNVPQSNPTPAGNIAGFPWWIVGLIGLGVILLVR